jgi:hypothetical protein
MRRTRPASRSVWRESLVVPLTSAVHRVPGTGTRAWAAWALEPPNRSRHSGGTVSVVRCSRPGPVGGVELLDVGGLSDHEPGEGQVGRDRIGVVPGEGQAAVERPPAGVPAQLDQAQHHTGVLGHGHQVLEDADGVTARRGRQPARPAGRVEEPLDRAPPPVGGGL